MIWPSYIHATCWYLSLDFEAISAEHSPPLQRVDKLKNLCNESSNYPKESYLIALSVVLTIPVKTQIWQWKPLALFTDNFGKNRVMKLCNIIPQHYSTVPSMLTFFVLFSSRNLSSVNLKLCLIVCVKKSVIKYYKKKKNMKMMTLLILLRNSCLFKV